ncbi:hypothetical protein OHB39_38360 [Streptomyces sp. NBC_00047]|uniref:hypothetical protein n=1 Tax=unclassified Streptomyces TaxID=2593676 RepID=UPI00214B4EB2|nr:MULTISPECIES: hypothetical protein [unclassified Streptomyces]MCX5613337.1 hypothetical protein [Streptomyces sp. NBC_00047]UUU37774.1 hypothetical protein JIW86_01965 [Streptomyces sp. NBC_00162]
MEPTTRFRPSVDLFPLRVVFCGFCQATAATGGARTLSAEGEFLSVTWHNPACPHHMADLILAEDD